MSEHQIAAQRIAEVIDRAWHGAGGGSDEGVCIGVIAAIALLGCADAKGPEPRDQILRCSDEEIARLLIEVWSLFTIVRPELAFRCEPFGEWLNSEPLDPHLLAGAGAVARAAVEAGLLDLTLDLQTAREVDLLGCVYTTVRSDRAKAARGEFYTPASLAEAMALVTLPGHAPGQSICDPTAGTGGLLRAAASALRAEGREPGEYHWYACDISPVAVAGLAVNAHLWGLGRHVVIGCANTLAEPDWERRALREQREAIEAQRTRVRTAHALSAMRTLLAGEDSAAASRPDGDATAVSDPVEKGGGR